MPLFTVDQDLCRRDGLCAAVCPASLVRLDDPAGLPYPLAGREAHCIRCGHCVAGGPADALRHSLLPLEDFPPIDRKRVLSPDLLTHHLRTRRSIRNFKSGEVPRETFAAILHTVRHAPSGHNHQPVAWTILEGRAAVSTFLSHVAEWMRGRSGQDPPVPDPEPGRGGRAVDKGRDVVTRGAPHVVFAHVRPRASPRRPTRSSPRPGSRSWPTPTGGHLLRGLSDVRPGASPGTGPVLGIPEGRVVPAALLAGVPKYRYRRMVPRDMPGVSFLNAVATAGA